MRELPPDGEVEKCPACGKEILWWRYKPWDGYMSIHIVHGTCGTPLPEHVFAKIALMWMPSFEDARKKVLARRDALRRRKRFPAQFGLGVLRGTIKRLSRKHGAARVAVALYRGSVEASQ